MLHIEGVSKSFGPVQVLRNVSEHFQAGSVHGLIGANGAGKSTLIKLISGLETPTSGKILLDGKETAFSSPQDAYAVGIRTLQQETDINLFTSLTVVENIVLRTRNRAGFRRLLSKADVESASRRLALVGAQNIPLQKTVSELPLAKRQQVALASALDENARVLILDEPTAALDRKDAERLLVVMKSIREHGAAIVFVSHHLAEIVEIADRVTILREGRLVDRFERPDEQSSGTAMPRIIASMTGNAALPNTDAPKPFIKSQSHANPRLQIANLVADSIRGISFDVQAGEVVTLTGLVGSGTSEVLKCIYGLRPVAAGSLTVDGKSLPWSSPARMVRNGIGLVPDDRQHLGLHLQQNIIWNTTLPVLELLTGPFGFLREGGLQRAAGEATQRVNLVANRLTMPTGALSGGNQQKVVIAKWLTSPRKLLLLDEPTRGVDISTRQQIYKLLRDLAQKDGLGILCSTYDFDEAVRLSDRILVMRRGEIVSEEHAEGATEQRLMDLAMGVNR